MSSSGDSTGGDSMDTSGYDTDGTRVISMSVHYLALSYYSPLPQKYSPPLRIKNYCGGALFFGARLEEGCNGKELIIFVFNL